MSAVRISVSETCRTEKDPTGFLMWHASTIQESRRSLKLEIIEWVLT